MKFTGTYLVGIACFYLIPPLFIAVRDKRFPLREILFSFFISIPFAVIVDFIGTTNGLWHVPSSIFPRFLGIIPFEDFVWMISAIFASIMLGKVFERPHLEKAFPKRIWFVGIPAYTALILFFAFYFKDGADLFSFATSYLYLALASVFFGIPTLVLIFHYKKGLWQYIPAILIFFSLTIVFEIAATFNSWWVFTGSYALPPLMISNTIIPLEELFFVGIVGPLMAILLYRFIFNRNDIRADFQT